MYKLILVDDKRDITEGIMKMGDWYQQGFEVCDRAFNGEEALKLIKEKKHNIVVTDIRMPKMDGIELTRRIKELDMNIKVILLSGYDDFAYAQQAIKLGAEEYLLKPVRINLIKEAVNRAKIKLDEERNSKEEIDLLNHKLVESFPLLKEKYFKYLLSSAKKDDLSKIKEKFDFLGINLETENIIIIIAELDNIHMINNKNYMEEFELYKNQVANTLREDVSRTCKCEVFRYDQNKIIILLNGDKKINLKENIHKAYKIAEIIRSTVENCSQNTITLAIGDISPTMEEIYYSFRNAQKILSYKLYLGGNRVITIDDIELGSKSLFKYPMNVEEELLFAIKIGRVEQIDVLVEKYLNDLLSEKKLSPQAFKNILIEFIGSVYRKILYTDSDKYGCTKELDYLVEINKLKTLDRIKDWMKQNLTMICQLMQEEKKSRLEKDIYKAKEYIYKYYNTNISLQKVANYICISPTYFSAVFKEYVGESFIEFLINYRIKKAKGLLVDGQYKIYEVANMVGYSDRRYFSELFKKHVGQNPAQYVQAIKNNDKNPPPCS
ncbi:response regulator transcription factor [Clostridium sp. DL1XJH146]